MPFMLINKIDDLFKLESMKKHGTKKEEELTKCLRLSEEEMKHVDEIIACANALFGPGRQPTTRQINLMATRGIQVAPSGTGVSAWKYGVIQTPKGSITY